MRWLQRFADRMRVRHHQVLEREARKRLAVTVDGEFIAARDRYLELTLCPDPVHCDHTRRR